MKLGRDLAKIVATEKLQYFAYVEISSRSISIIGHIAVISINLDLGLPVDIPMFELVGHSVAVGGCFDSLAEVASVVSPYPHGDTFKPLVDAILS